MIISSKPDRPNLFHERIHRIDNRGFTMLELVIAVVIFGIVVALIINSYTDQQGQSISQQQAVELEQTARASIYLISRDIRNAGYDPESKNDVGIVNAGDGSIGNPLTLSFYVESGSGFTKNNISYVLNDQDSDGDNDLVISYNSAPAQMFAENISNLTFSYYDQNNTVTTNLDEIRAIKVAIAVTTDSDELNRLKTNNVRTLTTMIKCRNLGL